MFSSVQFSRSVVSDSLRLHESQHTRSPCPSPTPGVHSNSHPLSQWCHPAIHNCVLFLLWLHPFILSGVISPLISSSILGTYWPGEFLFQYPISLPFHTVHGVLKERILKWFAILFSSGPHSVILSTMTHPSWVAPWAGLSFTELTDKAVVLVWLDWLVLCDYGFSVSALWCPLATPTVLLGFLLPWTRGISSPLPLLTLNMEWYGRCLILPEMICGSMCDVLPTREVNLSLGVQVFGVFLIIIFYSVQSLSCVRLFLTPWIAAFQASLSITNSWSLLKLMSIELMIPSSHLIPCWLLHFF